MKIEAIPKYHILINLFLTSFVVINFLLYLFKASILYYLWKNGSYFILYRLIDFLSQITYLGTFLLFIFSIFTLFFYLTRKINFKLIILSFLNIISLPIMLFSLLLDVIPFIQFFPALIFFYVIYLKKKMPSQIITDPSKKAYNIKLLVAGIFIVILVALIILFFPRDCGFWSTANVPGIMRKTCDCIGIEYEPPSMEGGADITCFGFPVSYKCFDRKGLEIPC